MVLTHEGVPLVISNPLVFLGLSNSLRNVFRIFISFDLPRGIFIISMHLCNILIFHDPWGLSLNFFFFLALLIFRESTRDILIFFWVLNYT